MNVTHQSARQTTHSIEQRRLAALDEFVRTKACSCPNFESLVAAARADGRSWPGDLALAIVKDIQRAHAAAASSAFSGQSGAAGAPPVSRFPDLHSVEQDARREWANDAAIRAEFLTCETYLAYRKAVARGSIGLVGNHKRRTGA